MERRLDYQIAGADITKCRQYRYSFWIIWDKSRPSVMFIGLNPAIADGNMVNPIHERCMDLARKWGYGGLHIANLFAFRSHSFEKLRTADDPVGEENNRYLLDMQKKCAKVIVAWGPDGSHLRRDEEVLSLIEEPYCLGRSVEGHPISPLDADNNIEPILFRN